MTSALVPAAHPVRELAGNPRAVSRPVPVPHSERLLPLAFHLVVVSALLAAGHPAWRIGVVIVGAALPPLQLWAWRKWGDAHCVKADAMQCARGAVSAQAGLFIGTWVAAAVTGGAHSPLLPTLITPYFGGLALVGDRRETRLLLGVIVVGASALALLPAPWTGPALPTAIHGALAVASFAGVGALLAPLQPSLRKGRQELSVAREEMVCEALARVRGLEQVGAKVAHELKNPLSAVKALVQLELRNPEGAASVQSLEIVEREVTRMQDILQDYLSFTRPLQEVTPQQTELGSLVAETLVVLSARADRRGVLLTSQGEAAVEADPRRLKEALLNLVANAIEATPPGGQVLVEVRPAGDHAQIVVRDSGSGMSPEVLQRLGTPFFTTREEGTGLGVVLARSVVAQHGGSLRYESAPGKGTIVTATIPMVVAARWRDGARAAGG